MGGWASVLTPTYLSSSIHAQGPWPQGCHQRSAHLCWCFKKGLRSHSLPEDRDRRGSNSSFLHPCSFQCSSQMHAFHSTPWTARRSCSSTHKQERTLEVTHTTLLSDSTTVVTWLYSQSCHFKVLAGARMAEIQDLMGDWICCYLDSDQNPANDPTRGKTLQELKDPKRLSQGPPFLLRSPDSWPERPSDEPLEDQAELRKAAFCGGTSTSPIDCGPDDKGYSSW